MVKQKTYKSEALAAIHETISDMYAAGVTGKQTMRRFDESCLTPVHEFTTEETEHIVSDLGLYDDLTPEECQIMTKERLKGERLSDTVIQQRNEGR